MKLVVATCVGNTHVAFNKVRDTVCRKASYDTAATSREHFRCRMMQTRHTAEKEGVASCCTVCNPHALLRRTSRQHLWGEHPIDSYGKYNMSRLAHLIKRTDSSFELCNVGRKHKAACISDQSRIIGR